MVLVGNIACIAICVLETFLFNGLWLAWGQVTAIFKARSDLIFATNVRGPMRCYLYEKNKNL